MTGPPALTADAMRRVLYRHFSDRYAVLFEISTDLDSGTLVKETYRMRRRIDVLLVRRAQKKGIGPLDLLAIEIKVARGDFLADLRDPEKQVPWRQIAHRHAYAAPKGLIRAGEVPAGSGLIETGPARWNPRDAETAWTTRAPYTDTGPELPSWLILALACRAGQAEAKLRGIIGHEGQIGADEDLRGALIAARKTAETARNQADSYRGQARCWKALYAATGGLVPCAYCGEPVMPLSFREGHFSKWRHTSPAAEPGCAALRESWEDPEPAGGFPAMETTNLEAVNA